MGLVCSATGWPLSLPETSVAFLLALFSETATSKKKEKKKERGARSDSAKTQVKLFRRDEISVRFFSLSGNEVVSPAQYTLMFFACFYAAAQL